MGKPKNKKSVESPQQRVERHVVQALAQDRSPMALVRLGLEAVRSCQAVSEDLYRDYKPPLACSEGCDLCCYPPVSATVPEVANIVAYVLSRLPTEEQDRIERRVHEVARQVALLTGRQRIERNIACPYLRDGCCTIYEVRPLACRGFNSTDRSVCEKVFAQPEAPPPVPAFVPLMASAQGLKQGLFVGLEQSGLPNPMVDLVKGSKKLLDSLDETLEEWLEGKDVFADCQPFRA